MNSIDRKQYADLLVKYHRCIGSANWDTVHQTELSKRMAALVISEKDEQEAMKMQWPWYAKQISK